MDIKKLLPRRILLYCAMKFKYIRRAQQNYSDKNSNKMKYLSISFDFA